VRPIAPARPADTPATPWVPSFRRISHPVQASGTSAQPQTLTYPMTVDNVPPYEQSLRTIRSIPAAPPPQYDRPYDRFVRSQQPQFSAPSGSANFATSAFAGDPSASPYQSHGFVRPHPQPAHAPEGSSIFVAPLGSSNHPPPDVTYSYPANEYQLRNVAPGGSSNGAQYAHHSSTMPSLLNTGHPTAVRLGYGRAPEMPHTQEQYFRPAQPRMIYQEPPIQARHAYYGHTPFPTSVQPHTVNVHDVCPVHNAPFHVCHPSCIQHAEFQLRAATAHPAPAQSENSGFHADPEYTDFIPHHANPGYMDYRPQRERHSGGGSERRSVSAAPLFSNSLNANALWNDYEVLQGSNHTLVKLATAIKIVHKATYTGEGDPVARVTLFNSLMSNISDVAPDFSMLYPGIRQVTSRDSSHALPDVCQTYMYCALKNLCAPGSEAYAVVTSCENRTGVNDGVLALHKLRDKALPNQAHTVQCVLDQMALTLFPSNSPPEPFFRALTDLVVVHDTLVPPSERITEFKQAALILSKLPTSTAWLPLVNQLAKPPHGHDNLVAYVPNLDFMIREITSYYIINIERVKLAKSGHGSKPGQTAFLINHESDIDNDYESDSDNLELQLAFAASKIAEDPNGFAEFSADNSDNQVLARARRLICETNQECVAFSER
jgi:hypothetical protein